MKTSDDDPNELRDFKTYVFSGAWSLERLHPKIGEVARTEYREADTFCIESNYEHRLSIVIASQR